MWNKKLNSFIFRDNYSIILFELYHNWPFIIRHWIVNHCKVSNIKANKNGLTLFIDIEPQVFFEFSSIKENIKNWINIYFCENLISDVIYNPNLVLNR